MLIEEDLVVQGNNILGENIFHNIYYCNMCYEISHYKFKKGLIYIQHKEIDNTLLLKYMIENDMIDVEHIQEQMEMKERRQLLEQHTSKIWQGKDNRWYTYLPDEKEGRVLKKRSTKRAIEDVVIEYWKKKIENPTVEDIFYRWIDEKIEYHEISQATYDRYIIDFKRYFINDDCFYKRKIRQITGEDVEVFVKKTISQQNLSSKSYGNLRTLIYGIFKKCKNDITFSITQVMGDMQISKRAFKKSIKEDELEVFDDQEVATIEKYILHNQDIINLGILLIFFSGIRVGELCTLRREDIKGNILKVRRTETIFKNGDGKYVYGVKEFPKSDAGVRNIVLPSNSVWIAEKIKLLNPKGEYLFEKDGERLKALFFRKRLYSICVKNEITPKSPHKIRKTYGSILLDNGVDQRFVLEQMGHSDISCSENYYHRNRKTLDKKTVIMDNITELSFGQIGNIAKE